MLCSVKWEYLLFSHVAPQQHVCCENADYNFLKIICLFLEIFASSSILRTLVVVVGE